MADSKWKFVGAVPGVEDPNQLMTQGLGFPLRPVEGVPTEENSELIDQLPIAPARAMHWAGDYQSGVLYLEGYVVNDEGWQMIANTYTTEKAAPVSTGSPAWTMPETPTWTGQSNESVIYSGHRYQFNTGGWINGIRVWAPALSGTTNYRIVVIDNSDPEVPIYTAIEEPVLNNDAWTIITTFERLVTAGDDWIVYLDALDSGSDTLVTGGWAYEGQNNGVNPPAGQWNHHQNQGEMRISVTDLDAVDRKTELMGMISGTTVVFAETLDTDRSITYYLTGSPVDNTGAVIYATNMISTGPAGIPRPGQATTMTATVPVPLPTLYEELSGGVPTPTWATVTGYLAFDGVDQGGDANGYGVDIYFDEATTSPDWDFISYSGE